MPKNGDIHRHNTRSDVVFNLPYQRTVLFEKTPPYADANFLNSLPRKLKTLNPEKLRTDTTESWLAVLSIHIVRVFIVS